MVGEDLCWSGTWGGATVVSMGNFNDFRDRT